MCELILARCHINIKGIRGTRWMMNLKQDKIGSVWSHIDIIEGGISFYGKLRSKKKPN